MMKQQPSPPPPPTNVDFAGTLASLVAETGLRDRDIRVLLGLIADVEEVEWSVRDAARVTGVRPGDVERVAKRLTMRARAAGREPLIIPLRRGGRRVRLGIEGAALRKAVFGVASHAEPDRREQSVTAELREAERRREGEELERAQHQRETAAALQAEAAAAAATSDVTAFRHAVEPEAGPVLEELEELDAHTPDALDEARAADASLTRETVPVDVPALAGRPPAGIGSKTVEALARHVVRTGSDIYPADLDSVEGLTPRTAHTVRAWHEARTATEGNEWDS